MKLKHLLLLVGLTVIYPATLFSQSALCEKHDFTYKSVNDHKIKASIYLPPSKDKHPVVVYFHGGGFIFGNRDFGLETVLKEKLLANNYAVLSADYRLAPETKLGEMLKDASDVVQWLKLNGQQMYDIDTSKIAVAGSSSGGYLALSAGFDSKFSPDAIISISAPTGFSIPNIPMGDLTMLKQPGPYDIVKDSIVSYGDYDSRMTLWRFLAKNGLALYEIFGFDPFRDSDKLEKYKLTNNIKPDYPPTLLIHARNDRLVDLKQVELFYQFLKGKNIECGLYLVENGHGSELINQNPQSIDKMVEFLNIHLR